MIFSYQDALKYLYDNLPMFQRVGAVAFKKDLTNTYELCQSLGNPQHQFKCVHIAGTNGKGSVSHMLASILQASGYKTGLYTSPHLKEFTERIRINGAEVSQSFVVDFVNRIRPLIEEIRPSFFEITVAMAFYYFAQRKVDIAVIETGMGGLLDSTNVVTPVVSVVTNISWDHKELLGNTLAEIAAQKAGIIKAHVPVVISERQQEVENVFIEKARAEAADIFFASDEYTAVVSPDTGKMDILHHDVSFLRDVNLPLTGFYQRKNAPGVFKVVELLQQHFPISRGDLRKGLEEVIVNTNLKGRWQQLYSSPTVICDTAHNASGIQEVVKQLSTLRFRNLHIVLGMVKDKEPGQVLALLPKDARYYFCEPGIPRAMDAQRLEQEAEKYGLRGMAIRDVNEAKNTALRNASKEDLVFIGGSTYVVAEINEL